MIASQNSELPKMLDILNDLLRAEGISHQTLSTRLNVSSRSIKRYLRGDNLSIALMEKLCALARITLADLAILAARETGAERENLSVEQETALSQNPFTAFVLSLLCTGWTSQQVQEECLLSEVELIRHLTLLDRLGLIVLLPGNRVRTLIQKVIPWKPGGPMRKAFETIAKGGFIDMNYGAAGAIWELNTLQLPRIDEGRLRELMDDFMAAVMQLSTEECRTMSNHGRWYAVLIAIRQASPQQLLNTVPAI